MLIDFITESYHILKSRYPMAYFLGGGDINGLNWKELVTISSSFRQCVTKPTRKNKVLSIIITDLHPFYEEVKVIPPLEPDVKGIGKPSDHKTAVLTTKYNHKF